MYDSVVHFDLRKLFTELTKIYKLSTRQLKSAINYNSIYFYKLLIKNIN